MTATTIRYKRQALGVLVGCTLFAIIILAAAGSKSIIGASGVRLSGMDQYDWFVKADDDSFYIIENLKQMLIQYDTEKAYFFGAKHWLDEPGRPRNITYASGGAGYVLSREAIRKFVSATRNPELCRQGSYFHEDTEVGQCMQNSGVEFITPLEGKRHSMLPISIFDLINDQDSDSRTRRLWATRTSIPNIQKGWDCCSDRLISFHYVKPGQMRTIYYFIYKVKVAE